MLEKGQGVWWGWLLCSPGLRNYLPCNFQLCTAVQTDPLGQGNIPFFVYKAGSLINVQNHYPLFVCVCSFHPRVQFTVCETVTLNSIDVQGEQQ